MYKILAITAGVYLHTKHMDLNFPTREEAERELELIFKCAANAHLSLMKNEFEIV
jgi:hypothetical protein